MAFQPISVGTYLTTWLKSAGGNVTFEHAFGLEGRGRFHCKVCDSTLTVNLSDSVTKVDYTLQEFVKLHAHKPGHTTVSLSPGEVVVPKSALQQGVVTSLPALRVRVGRKFR
jgi:hypothetical protein